MATVLEEKSIGLDQKIPVLKGKLLWARDQGKTVQTQGFNLLQISPNWFPRKIGPLSKVGP
jgi:hypothetical protein